MESYLQLLLCRSFVFAQKEQISKKTPISKKAPKKTPILYKGSNSLKIQQFLKNTNEARLAGECPIKKGTVFYGMSGIFRSYFS